MRFPDELIAAWPPGALVALFLAASLLMIWRLEHLSRRGVEGTVLGTLVMPYCSGIGNLMFVFIVWRQGLPGEEVVTNCLVNNLTNMTLAIGLPAVFWGARLLPGVRPKTRRKRRDVEDQKLNRLSILFTLLAVLFFTGAVWALGRDGRLDLWDGAVLVGLFLFWQCFHVFDVLKSNVRQNRSLRWTVVLEFGVLVLGGYFVYASIQGLVGWLSQVESGFLSVRHLGWLSGWLMVLPNAGLALYYGHRRRPEVVYTSQVGDGHICIPLCIGLSALIAPLGLPAMFGTALGLLALAVLIHMACVLAFGQLPRVLGVVLTGVYGWFLYRGLLA